jgi:hypothetical protein
MRIIIMLLAATVVLTPCVQASAVVVRSADNGRTWQTVYEPSQPLSWPWPDGAISAQIVFSNQTSGAVFVSPTIRREEGAFYGSLATALPLSWTDGKEALVTASLTISSAGSVLEKHIASLAYLPSEMNVLKPENRRWKRPDGERIASWDSAWKEETASAGSARLSVTSPSGVLSEIPLPGRSGYFPVCKNTMLSGGGYGDVALSLGFGSDDNVYSATVAIFGPGFMLLAR